jgi:hypothetical protein
MGLEQYEMAARILKSYAGNQAAYRPEALWYLSLCYLKTGKYQESMETLQQLQLYQGAYLKDAYLLEKKLRRMR